MDKITLRNKYIARVQSKFADFRRCLNNVVEFEKALLLNQAGGDGSNAKDVNFSQVFEELKKAGLDTGKLQSRIGELDTVSKELDSDITKVSQVLTKLMSMIPNNEEFNRLIEQMRTKIAEVPDIADSSFTGLIDEQTQPGQATQPQATQPQVQLRNPEVVNNIVNKYQQVSGNTMNEAELNAFKNKLDEKPLSLLNTLLNKQSNDQFLRNMDRIYNDSGDLEFRKYL